MKRGGQPTLTPATRVGVFGKIMQGYATQNGNTNPFSPISFAYSQKRSPNLETENDLFSFVLTNAHEFFSSLSFVPTISSSSFSDNNHDNGSFYLFCSAQIMQDVKCTGKKNAVLSLSLF